MVNKQKNKYYCLKYMQSTKLQCNSHIHRDLSIGLFVYLAHLTLIAFTRLL